MIVETSEGPSLSRNDLLGWINDLLKVNLTKIEQLGTGAVHCQILDVIYPGKVPLHKVNWRAKFEYEFIYNFKILQQSFTKFNIPKFIDVERLIKARYQDNFEFAQWMYRYFQTHCPSWKDYDPIARRGNLEPELGFIEKASTKPSVAKDSVNKGPMMPNSKGKSILAPRLTNLKNDSFLSQRNSAGFGQEKSNNLFSSLPMKENEILADLNNMIERQKADKNPQLEILRAERDFYYSKLRDIDHILDVYTGTNVENLMNNIREVLYLTPEKIAIVCEDGDIKIKNKNEDDIDDKENRAEGEVASAELAKEKIGKAKQSLKTKDIMVIEDDDLEEVPTGINSATKQNMAFT